LQLAIYTKQINAPQAAKIETILASQFIWRDNRSLLFPPCKDVCLTGSAARRL